MQVSYEYVTILSGSRQLDNFSNASSRCLTSAIRPKTQQDGICLNIKLTCVKVFHILSSLEYLCRNSVSYNMIANYHSAIRENRIVRSLPYKCLDQPEVNYFMKFVRINRPIKFTKRNIIDIPTLCRMVNACDKLYLGIIF